MKRLIFIVFLAASTMITGCKKENKVEKDVEVTAITIAPATAVSVEIDKSVQLTASIEPKNATIKEVTWSSLTPSIAKVDEGSGLVTGIGVGTATIRATAKDGSGTTEDKDVVVFSDAASIVVNSTPNPLELILGEDTGQVTAVVYPLTASQEVTWSTSPMGIVEVSTTGVVTAIKGGSATITATATDGSGATGSCEVEVKVLVYSISITPNRLILIDEANGQLTASVSPSNASNKNIIWSSMHPDIASVSSSGEVTSHKKGIALIYATAADGSGTKNHCFVEVYITTDEGVTINGVTFATCNVHFPKVFAMSDIEPGMLYQWNRSVGWSTTNPMVNSAGGTTWVNSNASGSYWEYDNDPCPTGWTIPTQSQWAKLNDGSKVVKNWGATRLYIEDKSTGKSIYLPAGGYRNYDDGALKNVGTEGFYWTFTTTSGNNGTNAVAYSIDEDTESRMYMYERPSLRSFGYSVRCVKE